MYVYLRFYGASISQVIGARNEWWPNDIRGTLKAESFLTFVLQVKKNPEKNLTQETWPGRGSNLPAVWQARMLPPVPQRWTLGFEFASRSLHVGFVVGRFSRGFSRFPLPQNSFYHFFTFIHFIDPCDCAWKVVGRHPCKSQAFNIEASSHLIPRPGPLLDTNWYY